MKLDGKERVGRLGDPLLRVEDARFLTGHGRYVDDIRLPNTAYAYFVRSPHAHARVSAVDTSDALTMTGVLKILTAEDVTNDGLGAMPCRFFPAVVQGESHRPLRPLLAMDKVRHVGDIVAVVVAETFAQAQDAAEQVVVSYDVLRPAIALDRVLLDDAPKVWDEAGSNLCFQIEKGDRDAVAQAFAGAAHVSTLVFHYPRASANPLETRAALADFDSIERRYTLYCSCQAPFRQKEFIASEVLGIPESDIRVIAPDVGGAFGMKGAVYPEEALLVWASGKLGRPVKWTAERGESFLSDMHGRDQLISAEMALDKDGAILALRATGTVNVGAYLGYAGGAPGMGLGGNLAGVYHIPCVQSVVRAVFTNTSFLGPYRGTGKPEATFTIERLIDKASRELGIDPVAMRRRNLIRAAAMPYQTAGGQNYDSGDFENLLDATLDIANWDGFAERRAASKTIGRSRGIGIAMHCNPAGGFMSERMEIRIGRDGSAALHVGTQSSGQGHETMFAQMVSGWLNIPLRSIRVFQGDTDKILFGRGSFSERSAMVGGSALRRAADIVVDKATKIAAWMLKVAPEQVPFEDGMFRAPGSNRVVTFAEVARQSYEPGLPAEFGVGLDGVGSFSSPPSYPNGCTICEVEVDPHTGEFTVEKVASVNDAGVVVNPIMLKGQLQGSMAQGLGQVIAEEIIYDPDSGQLVSGSFMDYGMPRATDIPTITSAYRSIPAKNNPLGIKGGSEAGNMMAPPAVVNALVDALEGYGVTDLPMPCTPERVWRAINSGCAQQSTVSMSSNG